MIFQKKLLVGNFCCNRKEPKRESNKEGNLEENNKMREHKGKLSYFSVTGGESNLLKIRIT